MNIKQTLFNKSSIYLFSYSKLGFIRVILDLLYDEDIINEIVFWAWKSDDREKGHALSVMSLKSFFEWLSEAEQ